MKENAAFGEIEATFKRAVACLDDAGVPFLLGGSLAGWAYGGPKTHNDLDLMLKEEDAEPALVALEGVGMRPERPPEDWLLKAWDGDVLIDLIHHPIGLTIDDGAIARGEWLEVAAMRVRVMALEDVMTSKLLALGEHSLDFEGTLQLARSLRERIDWRELRVRTAGSPYARAFIFLADELGVSAGSGEAVPTPAPPPRVRVVE